MATDLKKWGRFSAILEDPRMRSSRKVVIGDGMDRQDNDSDRRRIVIRSPKHRQSRKKEPKRWILESGIGTIFLTLCSPSSLYIHRCSQGNDFQKGRKLI